MASPVSNIPAKPPCNRLITKILWLLGMDARAVWVSSLSYLVYEHHQPEAASRALPHLELSAQYSTDVQT